MRWLFNKRRRLTATRELPLLEAVRAAPVIDDSQMLDRNMRELRAKIAQLPDLAEFGDILDDHERVAALIAGILGASPYLSRLILADPAELLCMLRTPPGGYLQRTMILFSEAMSDCRRTEDAMKLLRQAKKRLALITALADLGGVWNVRRVTSALSKGADHMLRHALRFLLRNATEQGKLIASPDWPGMGDALEEDCGYFILGMGKYGARELNYSSDIDLIAFYDPRKAPLVPNQEASTFFVRLTRDLVKLMSERTSDGYVFRTDLRLRPDPGATQVALSVDAALHYYETVGQNWERAAFIKARCVAGDMKIGGEFLREMSPYIWRKNLDYAAIADIHAMKRQIHAHKGHGRIAVEGHNLKLGRGGIREIEFFVQTQQLIAGGRQSDLRRPTTIGALRRLAHRGWITAETSGDLENAYEFLRRIEHRLQMLDDEQTHSLPSKPDKFDRIAHFSGYEHPEDFTKAVRGHLETVQRHYAALFEDVPALSRTGAPGSLVFTGDSDDPETVKTLAEMGFSSPSSVIATVKAWHHGRHSAVRTARARERLTEFQPLLLEALAHTAHPDMALSTFDRFLAELPAGVQLFALLRNNPGLLELLAAIMGSAPRLARIVSRRPRLVDALLDPGFLGEAARPEELARLVREQMEQGRSYEDRLDRARRVGQEQMFLIGVGVLSGSISAEQAGFAYAALAGELTAALQAQVEAQLARQHGEIEGGEMAVLGMGKLGGREMTANSDLDLVIIYRFPAEQIVSSGLKPVAPAQFYARATQRLISALSAPTAEGGLYEVDMRLRPSGKSGPVATSLPAFVAYQNNDAWTWEHMALTRARVISGPPALKADIEATIRDVLRRPRDRAAIAADVRDMRRRIAQEKGGKGVWDLKYADGGLVDVEFIAQHLQLVHAAEHPEILDQNTVAALEKLRAAGHLAPEDADALLRAAHLYHALTQIMRLCQEGRFDPDKAPPGLKAMLSQAAGVPEFSHVAPLLEEVLASVAGRFDRLVS
jgi:glutamate-ammonia-ligase adenylyltransferase